MANLSTSWDIVISGFVATILEFALPVKSRSIFKSLSWLTDPKIWVLPSIFLGYLALFHAHNSNYEHFRIWRYHVLDLYVRFHSPNITIQCEIIFVSNALQIVLISQLVRKLSPLLIGTERAVKIIGTTRLKCLALTVSSSTINLAQILMITPNRAYIVAG